MRASSLSFRPATRTRTTIMKSLLLLVLGDCSHPDPILAPFLNLSPLLSLQPSASSARWPTVSTDADAPSEAVPVADSNTSDAAGAPSGGEADKRRPLAPSEPTARLPRPPLAPLTRPCWTP